MDTMVNTLIEESDPEEKQKIQDRIEAFTSQYVALNTFAQTRMTSLECALQKTTVCEDWIDKLSSFMGWRQSCQHGNHLPLPPSH